MSNSDFDEVEKICTDFLGDKPSKIVPIIGCLAAQDVGVETEIESRAVTLHLGTLRVTITTDAAMNLQHTLGQAIQRVEDEYRDGTPEEAWPVLSPEREMQVQRETDEEFRRVDHGGRR